MTVGSRIDALRAQLGISQAELARRASVPQSTMNGLIKSDYRWSPHLVRIARELRTTVAYLAGEVDDPSDGASPPPPKPTTQIVTMPMLLPGEDALTRMFLGVLKASPGMKEDELARELAKTLPTVLQLLRGPLIYDDQDIDADPHEGPEALPSADRARRRA